MLDSLDRNLCSPLTLAFALGIVARLLKSELSLPRDLYASLSIYLLFALGLKGGVELSSSSFASLFWPATVTLLLGCLTPLSSYLILRRLGRFGPADAAAVAAHYGSVSAVTFIAAQQFAAEMGAPAEGFLPTLLTLLESPGIHVALAIGVWQTRRASPAPAGQTEAAARPLGDVLHEILAGRSMMLLVGGLVVGFLTGHDGYAPVQPFFEGLFKGALTLFLLEMGLLAGERLGDLRRSGLFLAAFGIMAPVIHGAVAVLLGTWAGLSVGGVAVLAAMAASASYIAAPPAVRMTLPQANPTFYLTTSLAITFPFNLIVGIPLYFQLARWAGKG